MAKQNARPDAPIWVRPAPGSRRPKLSREQIAQAALAIADSEGFARLWGLSLQTWAAKQSTRDS